MRLTIIAATGGIGQQILEQALTGGHEVMAVVRDPAKLSRPVNAIAVDLGAPVHGLLEKAVQGADAVLSGLGPRSSADAGIASRGTLALIDAMHVTGARRLVVVSAAPIGTVASPARPKPPKHDPGDGFFMRHLFGPMTKAALRKQYEDLAIMEDIVRESGLDWTIVRPPRLTNKPLTGRYRTAHNQSLRGGMSISRADVAQLMLHLSHQADTIKEVIGVAN